MCNSDNMETTLFYLERFLVEASRQSMLCSNQKQYLPCQTYVHTTFTFCHGSGLTWSWTLNGSIWISYSYYVLYLQILYFYFLRQNCLNELQFIILLQTSEEDYDQVPIEQFGMAMLRGMGFTEEEGIGDKMKK